MKKRIYEIITRGLVLGMLSGCTMRPLRPGTARMESGWGSNGVPHFVSEMKQPENPSQAAQQTFERVTETETPVFVLGVPEEPARSEVVQEVAQAEGRKARRGAAPAAIQRTRIVERAGTSVGAAQKDVAREFGAKLASLRGIVWVGVVMFAFGLASLAWPPLRAIVGSITTSVALMAGGVALMVLPSLIVGNELLIMGVVTAGVMIWFFAHRHGELKGRVKELGKAAGG